MIYDLFVYLLARVCVAVLLLLPVMLCYLSERAWYGIMVLLCIDRQTVQSIGTTRGHLAARTAAQRVQPPYTNLKLCLPTPLCII
jgi:lauroyl/myristoyl acyltransferase